MTVNSVPFARSGGAPTSPASATVAAAAPPRPRSPGTGRTHGPECERCDHPTCRGIRARSLPLRGGHRAEYAREHARAAAVQARCPHLVMWFGESTQTYWVMTPDGLVEAEGVDELLLVLRPHTGHTPAPEPRRATASTPGPPREPTAPAPSDRPVVPHPRRESYSRHRTPGPGEGNPTLTEARWPASAAMTDRRTDTAPGRRRLLMRTGRT